MSEGNFSPADLAAMMNGNGCNGNNGMWNNPFMYLIWLAIFGNAGFGWGGNAAAAATNGALTRAEMADGFANQNMQMDLKGLQGSVSGGFADNNINNNANTNTITSAITNSAFASQNAIHDLQSANQMGFCSVNNNIGSLKYEMAQNCCDLKNAMHTEGEATRSLITANTIQDLRDKIAEKDNALQSAQLTLANANQTQNILSNLGKFVPTSCCSNSW